MKQTMRKKVFFVSEHPTNDAESMIALLKNVKNDAINFKVVLPKFRGSQLDSPAFFKNLRAEVRSENPDFIVFIRDLDGLESENDKVEKRMSWFSRVQNEADQKGIFFLAIYEMEALILADTDNLNRYYNTKININNPIYKEKPKEWLAEKTAKTQKGKYRESDALAIFSILDFDTIRKNHRGKYSFESFTKALQQKDIIHF